MVQVRKNSSVVVTFVAIGGASIATATVKKLIHHKLGTKLHDRKNESNYH